MDHLAIWNDSQNIVMNINHDLLEVVSIQLFIIICTVRFTSKKGHAEKFGFLVFRKYFRRKITKMPKRHC